MLRESTMKISSSSGMSPSESNPENWRSIERRQWWLSSTGILVSLLLTLGIVSFVLPAVHSGHGSLLARY